MCLLTYLFSDGSMGQTGEGAGCVAWATLDCCALGLLWARSESTWPGRGGTVQGRPWLWGQSRHLRYDDLSSDHWPKMSRCMQPNGRVLSSPSERCLQPKGKDLVMHSLHSDGLPVSLCFCDNSFFLFCPAPLWISPVKWFFFFLALCSLVYFVVWGPKENNPSVLSRFPSFSVTGLLSGWDQVLLTMIMMSLDHWSMVMGCQDMLCVHLWTPLMCASGDC